MLDFLYIGVSWVLLRWHDLFTVIGLNQDSGLSWTLSVVLLVITTRLLLLRFFIKQIRYQNSLRRLHPKAADVRARHPSDPAAQQREMLHLQQEAGIRPLTFFLPVLVQWAVFLGLYHVLRHLANMASRCEASNSAASTLTLYGFTGAQTCSASSATLTGAPLSGSLHDPAATIHHLGGSVSATWSVVLVLVLLGAAAALGTQLLMRDGRPGEPAGATSAVARFKCWTIPAVALGSALLLPVGALLYWLVSNSWSTAQLLCVKRVHPPMPPAGGTAAVTGPGPVPPDGGPQPPRPARGDTRVNTQTPASRRSGANPRKQRGRPKRRASLRSGPPPDRNRARAACRRRSKTEHFRR